MSASEKNWDFVVGGRLTMVNFLQRIDKADDNLREVSAQVVSSIG